MICFKNLLPSVISGVGRLLMEKYKGPEGSKDGSKKQNCPLSRSHRLCRKLLYVKYLATLINDRIFLAPLALVLLAW